MRRFFRLLVVSVVIFAAFALLARFVLHGEVSPTSLNESLATEAGSADQLLDVPGRCDRSASSTWECLIGDSSGSGGATYRVAVARGSSCWEAQRVDDFSESGMPRVVSGCVHLWQWSVVDAL